MQMTGVRNSVAANPLHSGTVGYGSGNIEFAIGAVGLEFQWRLTISRFDCHNVHRNFPYRA